MRLSASHSLSLSFALAALAFAPACIPNDQDAQDPSQVQGQNGQPGQMGQGQPGQMGQPGGMGQQPGQMGQPGGQPTYPGGYGQPQGQPGQPGQYVPPGGQPGPAQPGQPAAGGAATPIAPAMAAAATLPLQAMATQEAPGMQPDGGAFAGQFQEGQTLEQPINLQPNKCYTIIAAGMGVAELHIQLVTQPMPGMPPIILAQSAQNGPQAVLGGKSCWKFMSPIGAPGKVLVKAHKGQGMAAAQVFIK